MGFEYKHFLISKCACSKLASFVYIPGYIIWLPVGYNFSIHKLEAWNASRQNKLGKVVAPSAVNSQVNTHILVLANTAFLTLQMPQNPAWKPPGSTVNIPMMLPQCYSHYWTLGGKTGSHPDVGIRAALGQTYRHANGKKTRGHTISWMLHFAFNITRTLYSSGRRSCKEVAKLKSLWLSHIAIIKLRFFILYSPSVNLLTILVLIQDRPEPKSHETMLEHENPKAHENTDILGPHHPHRTCNMKLWCMQMAVGIESFFNPPCIKFTDTASSH